MGGPVVSILIPHYKTPELLTLCLRSIRKYTKNVPYEVVIIDNGSDDPDSIRQQAMLGGYKLIVKSQEGISGGKAHRIAIDEGIRRTSAPFVLAFHTDTIPVREDWLTYHLEQINAHPKIAAVGSYKLELLSPFKLACQRAEDFFQKLRGRGGMHSKSPFIRSHCALYRRSALDKLGLNYDDDQTAGLGVHRGLEEGGFECRFLPVSELLKRIVHLNHATTILNWDGRDEKSRRTRQTRQLQQFLSRAEVRGILADHSLDQAMCMPYAKAA